MTLEEAVAVLNREKHNDYETWETNGSEVRVWEGEYKQFAFFEFEAIAIAEKYERERPTIKVWGGTDWVVGDGLKIEGVS